MWYHYDNSNHDTVTIHSQHCSREYYLNFEVFWGTLEVYAQFLHFQDPDDQWVLIKWSIEY